VTRKRSRTGDRARSHPGANGGYLPAATSGVDRAIRVSAAVVELAVAGIAAYISHCHAYAVVREYGESGVTARLEPATIDGLVYAFMVILGVFVAWNYPVLAQKARSTSIPSWPRTYNHHAELIRSVWEDEGRSHPVPDLNTAVGACTAVVNCLNASRILPTPRMVFSAEHQMGSPEPRRATATNQGSQVRSGAVRRGKSSHVRLADEGIERLDRDDDLLTRPPDDVDPSVQALDHGQLVRRGQ
jgi:hypothetical protein